MENSILIKDAVKDALRFATTLTPGASYCDIRVKDTVIERIVSENGHITELTTERSCGAGVRVYTGGSGECGEYEAMGFAASSSLEQLRETVRLAYETALAGNSPCVLAPKEAITASYETPVEINPFDVPLSDKLAVLQTCSNEMTSIQGVSHYEAYLEFRREETIFADTDGSYITQSFFQSGGGVAAKAVSDSDTQKRSYYNLLRAGYEAVRSLNLPENARRVAQECVNLINAPECPDGIFDLVIMPTQLFMQIHESAGHPTELDRVLGSEAAFAGMSFITPADLNEKLRYGSEHITITADASDMFREKGLGTFGFDDEGVPAQCVTLVYKGIFTGFQSSRDNATVIKQASHGMGLADGWQNLPIVRMTNINLQPGDLSLEELIAGISYGLLLEENKSWSIDDKRINFQFACEIAYEIKNGKLTGKIFKNPIYHGKTTEFWNSCDGVCSISHRKMIGLPNCGKGQPLQIMRVGHACPPARFRGVKVGVKFENRQ